jgi:integrase
VTIKGTRQDAQKELTRLLAQRDTGTLLEPSKFTVEEYLRAWLDAPVVIGKVGKERREVSPKTVERYRQLADQQIYPLLGKIMLQKLKLVTVENWHSTLLQRGGKDGHPLSARTAGHAHRLLQRAPQRAVETEILARNVAAAIGAPAGSDTEVEILNADEMPSVLRKLEGRPLELIAIVDLATGLRRGELLALAWNNVDLDDARLRVERSLEETRAGLCFKTPKTKHGRRSISLPLGAVAALREHRSKQLELRMALGLGRPEPSALVFCNPDGSPMSPEKLSRDWGRACKPLGLPHVTLHSLRHTHVSALIAANVDVVEISRRIGHGSPAVTLRIYAHLFKSTDIAAAAAIEAALKMR